MISRSKKLFSKAQKIIPGGVNSPVRAFRAVGGNPLFIRRGSGACIEDVDGARYIDYVCSWGPLILGHAHPAVVKAIQKTAASGTSFGAPTEIELEMAASYRKRFPVHQDGADGKFRHRGVHERNPPGPRFHGPR